MCRPEFCIEKILRNHKRFLMFLFALSLFLGVFIPVKADAASIYLPSKIQIYGYKNPYTSIVPNEGWNLMHTYTYKRNKYGMVTSIVSKSKKKTDKTTYKYTFKDGLLTKAKVTYNKKSSSTTEYKYNKKNKVIAKMGYNNKGKLEEKTLYTYKGGKLVKESHYDKGLLANTYKYRWKKNKVSGYTEFFRNGKKGTSMTYYYKDGKLSSIEHTNDGDPNKTIMKYNSKGHLIEDESIDYSDSGVLRFYGYHDCKYNNKGRLISVTDSAPMNEEIILWYKNKYSTYKKYKRPKGDPMVYYDYLYPNDSNIVPAIPVK